jgi:hypothetical protein
MKKSLRIIMLVLLAGWGWRSVSLAAESYLTPRLRLTVGQDSNRMHTSDDQEGATFLEAVPGVSLTVFSGLNLQINADAEYAPRTFINGEKGDQQLWQAGIGVSYQQRVLTWELWGGAGGYKDSEIPDDDVQWFYLAPSFGWNCTASQQVYFRLYFSPSKYDSRLTYDGESEDGTLISAVAGWSILLDEKSDLWLEAFYENFSANEPVDEYYTFGAGGGVGRWMTDAGRLDLAARWGYQQYPEDIEGVTERNANPVRLSAQYAHRFSDWFTWELLGRWERLPTSDVSDEYNQWLVSTSLVFAWELPLTERR